MELGKQIREMRNKAEMNQDELAEKLFVTRQTISNWENDKSYPDIHSLLLLSELFHVSLDQLVKGDIEMMKKKIDEHDVAEFNQRGKVFTILLFISILSPIPLVYFLGAWGFIPWGIVMGIAIFQAMKIEQFKKNHDVQTFKEILAIQKGESLDDIIKQQEIGKRPYQKALAVVIVFIIGLLASALMFAVVTLLFPGR